MIRVAVITGGHGFDVPAFHWMLRELPGIDAYVMHLEDWAADYGHHRDEYDVIVFYNFTQETPRADQPGISGELRRALERLRESAVGILVLHHALLAFPEWEFWSELTGMSDRSFRSVSADLRLAVDVVDSQHATTLGSSGWQIVDEAYLMGSPDPQTLPLLATDHVGSMPVLAWTHRFGLIPVVALQLGHGPSAFENAGFRQFITRSIHWLAGE